jgi:serine/threonine protein kinase
MDGFLLHKTNLSTLLTHIKAGTLKEIGCGSYARVYKMEYTRCPNLVETCRFCIKIPTDTHEICIKQFYMSNLYDHYDYECEIKYQQQVYCKYPQMIVQIYDHWLHETSDIPELCPHVLDQPHGSAQGDSILKTGFILTELLPELDMHTYLKQIANPVKQFVAHSTNSTPLPYINILGVIFILINLVYILHHEFGVTHGDLRDRNIFLRYHSPDWQQSCTGGFLQDKLVLINTGGWEIKLGDFGLADTFNEGEGSFIIRDYEFLDNIYCLRNKWRHTCNSTIYNNIITFIKEEFLLDIYDRINKYRRDGQSITDARHAFWFNKHRVSPNSIFVYELPQRLIFKLSDIFPKGLLPSSMVFKTILTSTS